MTSAAGGPSAPRNAVPPRLDLLRLPVLGPFLRRRWARTALQVPLFLLAVAMILHGFFGSQLAPKNLATLLTWVHYRGFLVLALLVVGNVFCLGCPFVMVRDLARRLVRPARRWPRVLRTKWTAAALFVLVLFAYELFDLWGDPRATAGLIVVYFAAALAVDLVFRDASFCKWVCPIGQFNFLASTASPFEVAVRDPDACTSCTTHDCIRGTPPDPATGRSRQRGCELHLFQPAKVGNLDCTFCLDCVHACPHDNVGVLARLPASELFTTVRRSGIGRLEQRRDLAALSVVFTFGAILNAFGMVSPVYAVQAWMADVSGIRVEWPILAALFVAALIVEPVLLLGAAAFATRRLARLRTPLVSIAVRYAYALVPLGFGVWLAHYAFHLLTGFATVIPVLQLALRDLGWPVLGSPDWTYGGISSEAVVPIEFGFLALGLAGSIAVAWRLAGEDLPERPLRAALPWMALAIVLALVAGWLLLQPMEMRGTILGPS